MGLLDIYGLRRTPKDKQVKQAEEEEKLEPLPKIGMDELWPPSPRVKLLYIGLGFGLFNFILLGIWVYVMVALR
ncbi:MAG: hypothetical protein M9953_08115 [Thermomicrobiales bacterium]|nr:hypothetical protein [Thermomicrobiales bacterium]MCO5225286.1 hypothetical protein [Thermomicrobiales bacterium]MCO5228601.1 hypothetical protein [Thermomicrobiales bacterium]